MSVEATAGDLTLAKEFIDSFVKKTFDLVLNDGDTLPKKPASLYCTKEEIQGECLHVALEYLCDSGAPDFVSTTIARQAVDKMLELDQASFQADIQKDEFDKCEDEAEGNGDDNSASQCSTMYDCGKLAIETINTVHCICKKWKSKMPTLMKSRYNYEVYTHSEQNTRRKMEDKHIIVTQVNNLFALDKNFPSQAYFAVFDGHGGVEAASYTVAHFHNYLVKQETFNSDLDKALQQAFKLTDKMFLEKANTEGLRAGTTGVVAFFRDNTLHIGWLGDSEVTLCKRGMAVRMMEPHKPNRKDERQRIEDLGGCVVWFGDWRVNGNIAVSRSIGDRDHKPFVSADPDTAEFDLEGDEEYLILGCDGLWDTIAAPDVISIVQEYLGKGGARSKVAKLLVHSAIEHGSTDNITVVVVFLDCHRNQVNQAGEATENTNPVLDELNTDSENPTKESVTSEAYSTVTNGVLSGTKVLNSVSNLNSEEKSAQS